MTRKLRIACLALVALGMLAGGLAVSTPSAMAGGNGFFIHLDCGSCSGTGCLGCAPYYTAGLNRRCPLVGCTLESGAVTVCHYLCPTY